MSDAKIRAKQVLAGNAMADALLPLMSENGIVAVFFMALVAPGEDKGLFPVSAVHGVSHDVLPTVMMAAKDFLDGNRPDVEAVATVHQRPRKN